MRDVRAVLLDLDGCVWFGRELAPGAAEAVRSLRAAGLAVGFLTNISSGRSSDVAAKLTQLGIPAAAREVLMPIEALASHPRLADRPTALVVGRPEVRAAVAEVTPVSDDPDEASVVVLGRDPTVDYARLTEALQVLHRGGALLALNLDARVPVAGGRLVPGNGAIAALLSTASGVTPEVVGKPARFFFETALRRFGFEPHETVMVGDTLDSDIAGGAGAGLRTVLVGGSHFTSLEPPPAPDYEISALAELPALLGLAGAESGRAVSRR